MKYKLHTKSRKFLADTITPVSVYLRLRDKFPHSILLESSDYHANENAFSYICFQPMASIKVQNEELLKEFPDGKTERVSLNDSVNLVAEIQGFASNFEANPSSEKFIQNGLFGYMSYDAVRYFEDLKIKKKDGDLQIPDLYYAVYRNIIAINHFNNEAYVFSHSTDGSDNLDEISSLLKVKSFAEFEFKKQGTPQTNISDEEYKELVQKCKDHCQRGDVFQIVPSKRFIQKFSGDEFNVYRTLRSVNPSPYLFYFDYGDFKIFGSSPEAQLVINNRIVEIHPIAGTVKRTGNDEEDAVLAKKLSNDQKEKSEHVMLVDLARNDLSRNARNVRVEVFREVQYFSHVIHLVSKVTGEIQKEIHPFQVVADNFPAGTLSGAPKYKAMSLLEKYENVNRDFYGGAIGFMGFDGSFNHAIIIRSFVSKNHHLYYQAGAGVVSGSVPENELQEVYNKLGALNKALELAEQI
ncbi:MAG: anthranilate synthase component I family protein [Flavobacteriaceae bacterium]|jgi:anthranilate synthase component 1|nr:anthranilate synthase component I family protein [Flavobacteriaceae bacterium]